MNKEQIEVRISGFGGQGVILMGHILGQAASVHDRRFATLTQNYGPEARGSACRADLIVAKEAVDYPYVSKPDVLIALSQGGYVANRASLGNEGILLYEAAMVQPDEEDLEPGRHGNKVLSAAIPATALAVKAGGKIMANMVMIGFVVALTEVVSHEALLKSVEHSVPKGSEKNNLAAIDAGYQFGQQWLEQHGKHNGGATLARAEFICALAYVASAGSDMDKMDEMD